MALFTVKQAADRLGCSAALVYLLCAERRLGHVRLGTGRGTIRIDEADLAAFLEASRVEADSLAENLKHIRVR